MKFPSPSSETTLRVGSYNIMDGGGDRFPEQLKLLASMDLDILGIQEAKNWDRDDFARLHEAANALKMQALFAPSQNHGCHLVLLYRWPKVKCLRFQPDISGKKFHHTVARIQLEVGGISLLVLLAHLNPFSPSARLIETGWLTEYAAETTRSLIIGDLNTIGPYDPEPDWIRVPAHLHSRHRLALPDGSYEGYDRRAISLLMNAGFIDPTEHLSIRPPRTAGHWGRGSEYWDRRCDYVLVSPPIAPALQNHFVVDTSLSQKLGDHLPLFNDLDLSNLR